MATETVYTITAVGPEDSSVPLVFEEVSVTPSVTPYSRQISLTIGTDVYTFDTADLLDLARRVAGV